MHEKGCGCGACTMVRDYLKGGATADHPICCVCPLCAAPRMYLRRAERGTIETNDFGPMYARAIAAAKHEPIPREKGVFNSWWAYQALDAEEKTTIADWFANLNRLTANINGSASAFGGRNVIVPLHYGHGEIDPPELVTREQIDRLRADYEADQNDTFDLLHDMGITMRTTDPETP